jgi:hypothetical protein
MTKKEHVQKITAVISAYFVLAGHLTREEAKGISGLDEAHFEQAYAKAGNIFNQIGSEPDKGLSKLFNHLGVEVDEYMKHISGLGIA